MKATVKAITGRSVCGPTIIQCCSGDAQGLKGLRRGVSASREEIYIPPDESDGHRKGNNW